MASVGLAATYFHWEAPHTMTTAGTIQQSYRCALDLNQNLARFAEQSKKEFSRECNHAFTTTSQRFMLQERERGFQCCSYFIAKDKSYPFIDFSNPVGIYESQIICTFYNACFSFSSFGIYCQSWCQAGDCAAWDQRPQNLSIGLMIESKIYRYFGPLERVPMPRTIRQVRVARCQLSF